MTEEYDALTDKLLEISMKLRAVEGELAAYKIQQEKDLSKFSHNLKNPVGVISSFVEMLQGNSSFDEVKRSKYLDIIQSSSKFSLALVNSFQEFNKLKNNSVSFEIEAENYVAMLQEAIAKTTSKIESRNQTIAFQSHIDAATCCELDKIQVQKVFCDVLDNASRFSSENSIISVEVTEDETNLITTVSDTGIGISSEELPKLTQAFFTANTYDAFKEKCLGLGLAKSNLILNQMEGSFSFSSELEKGTQVKVMLKKL